MEISDLLPILSQIDKRLSVIEETRFKQGSLSEPSSNNMTISSQFRDKSQFKIPKEEKIKIAIEAIHEGNNSKIARKYTICESTVRSWIAKYSEEIEESILGKRNMKNQSKAKVREGKFPEMEAALLCWINDQRSKNSLLQ